MKQVERRPDIEALQRLIEAQQALDHAEAHRSEATAERDKAITDARDAGIPASTIATQLGVDRQMIYRALRRQ